MLNAAPAGAGIALPVPPPGSGPLISPLLAGPKTGPGATLPKNALYHWSTTMLSALAGVPTIVSVSAESAIANLQIFQAICRLHQSRRAMLDWANVVLPFCATDR